MGLPACPHEQPTRRDSQANQQSHKGGLGHKKAVLNLPENTSMVLALPIRDSVRCSPYRDLLTRSGSERPFRVAIPLHRRFRESQICIRFSQDTPQRAATADGVLKSVATKTPAHSRAKYAKAAVATHLPPNKWSPFRDSGEKLVARESPQT